MSAAVTYGSGWFSVVCMIDMVMLLLSMSFHALGVYLLLYRRKIRKNQHIILIHLSISEFLISFFRFLTMFYFYENEEQDLIIGYQVLRSITIQGLCVSYVFIMIVVTLDPLLIILLKVRYTTYLNKRRLYIILASCWFVGLLNVIINFTIDYETREKIAAKYTFPTISTLFLSFACVAYTIIYKTLRDGQKLIQRTSVLQMKSRSIKIKVPALIMFTFFLFVALPSAIQVAAHTSFKKIHLAMLGVSYSTGFVLDALIYVCLQPTTRQLLFLTNRKTRVHIAEYTSKGGGGDNNNIVVEKQFIPTPLPTKEINNNLTVEQCKL